MRRGCLVTPPRFFSGLPNIFVNLTFSFLSFRARTTVQESEISSMQEKVSFSNVNFMDILEPTFFVVAHKLVII